MRCGKRLCPRTLIAARLRPSRSTRRSATHSATRPGSSASDNPRRYRTVIYGSAEQVLLDGLNGEASDADSNNAFRSAYPEYFAQAGASANLVHQRFRRAREDVKALLQAVFDRNELT
jgi:hypothetical protein